MVAESQILHIGRLLWLLCTFRRTWLAINNGDFDVFQFFDFVELVLFLGKTRQKRLISINLTISCYIQLILLTFPFIRALSLMFHAGKAEWALCFTLLINRILALLLSFAAPGVFRIFGRIACASLNLGFVGAFRFHSFFGRPAHDLQLWLALRTDWFE